MRNYWTCTSFADWLRGTTKLKCGTSEQWDEWEERAKRDYPVRWWLAEEGLDYVQRFIMFIPDKLHAVKYYINNRWITRTHALTAHPRDIPRGEWRDVGNRFLPCLFNELVDFVEVELAWWHLAWNAEERDKYNMPWWAVGWWRVRTWRCPEAGLDNLDWQRALVWTEDDVGKNSPSLGKPTQQAIAAQEIYDLYKWWTETYRNRPDPYDASGWSAVCEEQRLANGGKFSLSMPKDPALQKKSNKAHKLLQKIETQYEKEDEEMMIRLIKIRQGLWT